MACSVLYYIDARTGKIYAVNNEDYWYNVKPYIQIIPKSKKGLGRLWYGWNNFAQGGINEAGLFFDGATTPEQETPKGYTDPNRNLGDEILSKCKTVAEAIAFMEGKKIALKKAHIMFGDRTGNAVVIEWIDGVKNVISIHDHQLIITNFLLSDTTKGNYPCKRYQALESGLKILSLQNNNDIKLKDVGNVLSRAVQPPAKDANGNVGGTLYSTFMNISDMEFILVYKLDNSKITKLDLKLELVTGKNRKIKLR
jgi:penicillin V acylase-like amidase (Ntn superfamily)